MKKYFLWKGRMNRQRYFLALLALTVISWGIMLLFLPGIFGMQAEMINGEMSPEFIAEIMKIQMITMIINIPMTYLTICWAIQRFHDIDKSGFHYFWFLVPFANIYFAFVLLFKKGTEGPNQFGVDPLGVKCDQQMSY